MSQMTRILKDAKLFEFLKNLALLVMVIGVGVMIYGAYAYYTTDQDLSEVTEQRKAIEESLASITSLDVTAIGMSDIQLRREQNRLLDERRQAAILIGAGIITLAAAWLVRDLSSGRLKQLQLAESY